jgi:hypothetical protein
LEEVLKNVEEMIERDGHKILGLMETAVPVTCTGEHGSERYWSGYLEVTSAVLRIEMLPRTMSLPE